MLYQDFAKQFHDAAQAALLLRMCELAMRLPPGVFTHDDLMRTMLERRDQLFAEILGDDLVRPLLTADPMSAIQTLQVAQLALDQQRTDVTKELRAAHQAGASTEALVAKAKARGLIVQ